MLEKYDPGLIAGTIGAVIGIMLASIFEKSKIVHRFSKLRKILTDELEGLNQNLDKLPANLVREASEMVRDERDVPPWFRVIRRYRESNKMAKLISKIESAQCLLRQAFYLEQILISHQKKTSRLLETLTSHQDQTSSEQQSRLEKTLISHQEQTSRLEKTLISYQEQTSRLEKTLISHQEQTSRLEKTLISHQEQTSRLEKTLISHQEQTSRLEKTLISHQEQTSRLEKTLTDTAEEMTSEEKPMPAVLRRRKMVLKFMIEDEKSTRMAMKAIAGVEGVESVAVDMKEKKITVVGEADPVFLTLKVRKFGLTELLSVGPAKEEKKPEEKKEGAKKEEKKLEPATVMYMNPSSYAPYPYYPYPYTVVTEEYNPNTCTIC